MKTACKWLGIIVVVCFIILVGILFLPKMIGLQPLAILNDRMNPTYKEGSLLYLKEIEQYRVKLGDPVVILLEGGEHILQRITKIDDEKNNITVKSDAVETEHEQLISTQQIIGTPVVAIPYLGFVAVKLNTTLGKVIFLGVILSVFLATFIPNLINKIKSFRVTEV